MTAALSRGQRAALEAVDELERVELKLYQLANRCTDAQLALKMRIGAIAVMSALEALKEAAESRGPRAWEEARYGT
jgi:hypothetical protein